MTKRIEGIIQVMILLAFAVLGIAGIIAGIVEGAWWAILIGVCSLVVAKMHYTCIKREVNNKLLKEKGHEKF